VVPAGSRDLDRALGRLLALHVPQIRVLAAVIDERGLRSAEQLRALEVIDQREQR